MKLLAILSLVACMTMACNAADRASQIDDIREATFRYQFVKNASMQQTSAKVYFLSLTDLEKHRGLDPSDVFMKRFDGHKPRVAKASQAKTSIEDGARDAKTGEDGIIFSIYEINWKSDSEVEVAGGYYEGSESASYNTYYLVKKGGKWIVERNVMHTISLNTPNQALQHNDPSCHESCLRTPRASRGRG